MIGDIIIIEQRHKDKVQSYLSKIKKRSIVLISGPPGTGKSEQARCISQELDKDGINCFEISLDDYYETFFIDRNKMRKQKGIDYVGINEIQWNKLYKICARFKEKKFFRIQRIHRFAKIIEHTLIKNCKNIDVLIIEGLYTNYLSKKGFGDLSIFLEGKPHQTKRFRLKRMKEDPDDNFRKEIVKRETEIVYSLSNYASIKVPFDFRKKGYRELE